MKVCIFSIHIVTYEQNDTAYYVEIKNKENVQVNESAEALLHRELIGSGQNSTYYFCIDNFVSYVFRS